MNNFVEMTDAQRQQKMLEAIAQSIYSLPKDIESISMVIVTKSKPDEMEETSDIMIASGAHICGINMKEEEPDIGKLKLLLAQAMIEYATNMIEEQLM